MPYYLANQQMAAARAAAMARQQELWNKAQQSAVKLDAAERAYARGDIFLAGKFYTSLARSRPKTAISQTAQQRLEALAKEARRKLAETDATLEKYSEKLSASDWRNKESWPDDLPKTVAAAFQAYDKIVDDYGVMIAVRRELESHEASQRRRPEYAAVLNEPEAEALLSLARRHEEQDEQCCAFWVYEEASKLSPAPSSQAAAERLAAMKQDAEIVAAAERCRQLQWCHRRYNLAEQLVAARPERAREYFEEIIERSPADSPVHQAARTRLAAIDEGQP